MKTFVCIRDNVFFNKKIYNVGDRITVDEVLEKEVGSKSFQDAESYEKEREKVIRKVESAEKNGKSIKEVISEAEEEKKRLAKSYEAKIEKLEKQINPKGRNDL